MVIHFFQSLYLVLLTLCKFLLGENAAVQTHIRNQTRTKPFLSLIPFDWRTSWMKISSRSSSLSMPNLTRFCTRTEIESSLISSLIKRVTSCNEIMSSLHSFTDLPHLSSLFKIKSTFFYCCVPLSSLPNRKSTFFYCCDSYVALLMLSLRSFTDVPPFFYNPK